MIACRHEGLVGLDSDVEFLTEVETGLPLVELQRVLPLAVLGFLGTKLLSVCGVQPRSLLHFFLTLSFPGLNESEASEDKHKHPSLAMDELGHPPPSHCCLLSVRNSTSSVYWHWRTDLPTVFPTSELSVSPLGDVESIPCELFISCG